MVGEAVEESVEEFEEILGEDEPYLVEEIVEGAPAAPALCPFCGAAFVGGFIQIGGNSNYHCRRCSGAVHYDRSGRRSCSVLRDGRRYTYEMDRGGRAGRHIGTRPSHPSPDRDRAEARAARTARPHRTVLTPAAVVPRRTSPVARAMGNSRAQRAVLRPATVVPTTDPVGRAMRAGRPRQTTPTRATTRTRTAATRTAATRTTRRAPRRNRAQRTTRRTPPSQAQQTSRVRRKMRSTTPNAHRTNRARRTPSRTPSHRTPGRVRRTPG